MISKNLTTEFIAAEVCLRNFQLILLFLTDCLINMNNDDGRSAHLSEQNVHSSNLEGWESLQRYGSMRWDEHQTALSSLASSIPNPSALSVSVWPSADAWISQLCSLNLKLSKFSQKIKSEKQK